MENLPDELFQKIFSYLSPKDQARCEMVCRNMFNLVTENIRKGFDWRFSVHNQGDCIDEPLNYAMDVQLILVSSSIDDNKKNTKYVDVQINCNRIEEAVEYLAVRAGDMIKSVSFPGFTKSSTLLSILKSKCPNLVQVKLEHEECRSNTRGVAHSKRYKRRKTSIVPSLFFHRNLSRLVLKDVRVDIPPSFFDGINNADVIKLTHLYLERVHMQEALCLDMFYHCCANLQFLYIDGYVNFTAPVRVEECFSFSPGIKNLTFCKNPSTLNGLFRYLPNLESLCLGGSSVDSNVVNAIPQEVLSKLLYLNVSYCKVDKRILESLRARPEDAPMLCVFAFGTKLKVNCVGSNWRVVMDTLPEDGLFYGFEATECRSRLQYSNNI